MKGKRTHLFNNGQVILLFLRVKHNIYPHTNVDVT